MIINIFFPPSSQTPKGTSWIHQKAASRLNPELARTSFSSLPTNPNNCVYRDTYASYYDTDLSSNEDLPPLPVSNSVNSGTPLLSQPELSQPQPQTSVPTFFAPPPNVKWYENIQEWCYIIASSKPFEVFILSLVAILMVLTIVQSYLECYREEENPADR